MYIECNNILQIQQTEILDSKRKLSGTSEEDTVVMILELEFGLLAAR